MTAGARSKPRLAVLISGTGRNFLAIHQAIVDGRINAEIAVVISNKADAAGLTAARQLNLPTQVLPAEKGESRAEYDVRFAQALETAKPDWIILAGFMRILSAELVNRYIGRMVNIHPSLLPKYQGLNTHRRALQAKDRLHGASVHFVTPELDGGPVIIQGELMVSAQDTEESLADRVMNEIELKIYPQAVAWLTQNCLSLNGAEVVFNGKTLPKPLTLSALGQEFSL